MRYGKCSSEGSASPTVSYKAGGRVNTAFPTRLCAEPLDKVVIRSISVFKWLGEMKHSDWPSQFSR